MRLRALGGLSAFGKTRSIHPAAWLGLAVCVLPVAMLAQLPVLPPAAASQLQQVIGDRVELGTILGGDYSAAGGIYTFRGGTVANLSLTKIGGSGAIAAARPIGVAEIRWAPVLIGNVGQFTAEDQFDQGYLQGNKSSYETVAVQLGGGAQFFFTEHLSLIPTLSGMYGHTENDFTAQNAIGQFVKAVASGTYVDWSVDTWSIVPGIELRYEWMWQRASFTFGSRFEYYHTESFDSSSAVVGVNGDSQTWENKLDADVPLGWRMLGGEIHTGGFFSRTELYGGAAEGVNASSFYTANGRFVFDFNGKLWKLRWMGLGASYFWGNQFSGWSAGLDLSFKF